MTHHEHRDLGRFRLARIGERVYRLRDGGRLTPGSPRAWRMASPNFEPRVDMLAAILAEHARLARERKGARK